MPAISAGAEESRARSRTMTDLTPHIETPEPAGARLENGRAVSV